MPSSLFTSQTLSIFTDGSIRSIEGYKNHWDVCAAAVAYDRDCISADTLIMRDSTNNAAELMAIQLGVNLALQLQHSHRHNRIILFSDSEYSVNTLRTWIWGWIRNSAYDRNDLRTYAGLRTNRNSPVQNKEIILSIIDSICLFANTNQSFNLFHCISHQKTNYAMIRDQFLRINNLEITLDDAEIIGLRNDTVDRLAYTTLRDGNSREGHPFPFYTVPNMDKYYTVMKRR